MRARRLIAVCAVALLAGSCASKLPWHDQPVADEVNVAFVVERNLLYVPSVTIDHRPGRFFFSTAAPRTVFDPRFMSATPSEAHTIDLNERESLSCSPVSLTLGGTGDAMIGAEVWDNRAVTVDYHAGLLTFQKTGIFPGLMTLYNFRGQPKVNLTVDGRELSAIVDTASPDTIELPSDRNGRGRAHVTLAGFDFGNIDVKLSPAVTEARLGNRILSKFLVSIDYGRGVVGLWQDPRNR